jgi:hypothetical protein
MLSQATCIGWATKRAPSVATTWCECMAINVNNIRKIVGLDEPKQEALNDWQQTAETVRKK